MIFRRAFFALLTAISICSPWFVVAESECDRRDVILRGEWGEARFHVEIADDGESRSKGLMYRNSMPSMSGMLFIYDSPQSVRFWMRNTLIPLDMLFFDQNLTLQKIHENAIPLDETPIPGGDEVLMVLEINGGMGRLLGINQGTTLKILPKQGGKSASSCWWE